MMFRITINNKDYNIPTAYSELPFVDYVRIFKDIKGIDGNTDEEKLYNANKLQAKIASNIMGEDDEFVMDLPLPIAASIIDKVSFIFDTEKIRSSERNEIEVDGIKYHIPPTDRMELRQWIDADYSLKADDLVGLLSTLLISDKYRGEDKKIRAWLTNKAMSDEVLPLLYYFFLKGRLSQMLTKATEAMSQVLPPTKSL